MPPTDPQAPLTEGPDAPGASTRTYSWQQPGSWYVTELKRLFPELSDEAVVRHLNWRNPPDSVFFDAIVRNLRDARDRQPVPAPAAPPPVPRLRPLHVDGLWFSTDDGQPWTQIGCSDFRLLQRFLAGEAIDPILEERATAGFNQLRVFLMCDLMFHLYPQEHPDYIPKLIAFLDRLAAHQLRAELTVLVDVTRVMPSLAAQQAFFAQVVAGVRGRPDVMVELVNENDQTINATAAATFARPEGVIVSRGSNGADAPPVGCSWIIENGAIAGPRIDVPPWDYVTQHPSRPADWPRRVGHNTMEWADATHAPATANETCRPDQGRGPIPSDFFDAAANAALLCAGATFHSDAGKASRLFTPAERACAEAWSAGARAVPLSYRKGRYIAGHLTGFPLVWQPGDSSRAHGRLIDTRACLSLPQMREGYVPRAVDGWRVVKQTQSVVEVTRA